MAFRKNPEKIKIDKEKKDLEKMSPASEQEKSFEVQPEKKEGRSEKMAEQKEGGDQIERIGEGSSGLATKKTIQGRKEERLKKIEEVLEEELEDIYAEMPPEKQKEFQKEGEETVKKIDELLRKTKVNIKKIAGLIKRWLSIIPGINKFFLEQEAKIKADKIIKIKEDKYYK